MRTSDKPHVYFPDDGSKACRQCHDYDARNDNGLCWSCSHADSYVMACVPGGCVVSTCPCYMGEPPCILCGGKKDRGLHLDPKEIELRLGWIVEDAADGRRGVVVWTPKDAAEYNAAKEANLPVKRWPPSVPMLALNDYVIQQGPGVQAITNNIEKTWTPVKVADMTTEERVIHTSWTHVEPQADWYDDGEIPEDEQRPFAIVSALLPEGRLDELMAWGECRTLEDLVIEVAKHIDSIRGFYALAQETKEIRDTMPTPLVELLEARDA